MLEGALIALIGFAIGRFMPGRRKGPKPPPPPPPVKPICGCKHSVSFHDDKGCHYVETVMFEERELQRDDKGRVVRDRFGDPVKLNRVREPLRKPCSCLRYTGPEPMTTYYAQEIAT